MSESSGPRLDLSSCRATLRRRLSEAAPGRVQVLTGPRQVGKTTLLLDLARELGERALYLAADGPEASLPGSWERLWMRAAEIASTEAPAVVMLDEVQYFERWAERLKGEWDAVRRRKTPVHVIATGSSALGLRRGTRESLAGRFERLTVSHWPAAALAESFRLAPEDAARIAVLEGTYPGAMDLRAEPARWKAYVRDAIVEPAVGRDILALADVRRPALLRQVFAVAASSPAQVISLQKLQGALRDRGALATIAHYLALLEEAFLVAPLQKHAARPARERAAPPKLVVLSNAICATIDPRGTPDFEHEPQRFGAWLENACLAHAVNSGQRVTYWREEPLDVDGVVDGSWGKWAIEVKSGAFGGVDLRGLAEFTRRFPAYRPLVVCGAAHVASAERFGFAAMSWERFLLGAGPSDSAPVP